MIGLMELYHVIQQNPVSTSIFSETNYTMETSNHAHLHYNVTEV